MSKEKQKFRKIKLRSFTLPIHLNKIFIYRMIQRIKKVLFAADLIMTYKLIRIDGKDDKLTAKIFDNYSDAYNLLEELYGDSCCSDADYGNITYYDIVENNLNNKNG